jgi:serine/threonine-protein kinase
MTDRADRWRRLEAVVQSALDRPASERAAYLAEACGADDDLRREALSLIAREQERNDFLALPLGQLAADALTYSPGGTPVTGEPGLSPGARIGTFEVGERLGAGGMGEVYRARDLTLHRDVAIKVLPAAFLADAERLARFEREARLLAALNHPHVASVYGLEGAGERRAIVLELIEGETLEQRLQRGTLTLAETLTYARQMAEALDHAHRRGVTHRDLKPSNVMITRAGVKLLDFGLARWTQQQAGYQRQSGDGTPRPAGVESLTEKGTILGTLHYMAPEQIEGRPVDARADIFAFGAVLYEMLTSRKAFDGGSAASVMAAVLNTTPSLDELTGLGPAALARIVGKCLAKDPDDRWQTARDLADALNWVADDLARPVTPRPGGVPVRDDATRHKAARWMWVALLATAAAVAGATIWSLAGRNTAVSPAIAHLSIQPSRIAHDYAISPDGGAIVYTGNVDVNGRPQLFLRRFDQSADTVIAGTEDAESPFYSPDGQWVAYFAARRLMKVNVTTGSAPVLICACPGSANGAVWLDDGTILFTQEDHALLTVSAEGGEPAELTSLSTSPPEADHHSPAPLPAGAVLYTSHAADGHFDVVAFRPATGERKVVLELADDAKYLSSGHLVFHRNAGIHVVAFDAGRFEVSGPVVTLVDRIGNDPSGRIGGYDVSADGTLVFRPAPSLEGRTLAWVSRTGEETAIPLAARAFHSPRASPDGTRIAFAVTERGRNDIYVYELASTKLTPLTRTGNNKTPLWTPDSQRLVYASDRDGTPRLWWEPADGGGSPEPIVAGDFALFPGSWSADGRTLVYTDDHMVRTSRVLAIDVRGDRKPRAVLPELMTRAPSLSPDGRWLALTVSEAPRVQVYVTDFPETKGRRQVSIGGGRQPLWSRDGRELVYRSGQRVMSVAVDSTGGLRFSAPKVLFERYYATGDREVIGLDYDLAGDGRLLMIKPSPDELRFSLGSSLTVVLNWMEEVKRRVPSRR